MHPGSDTSKNITSDSVLCNIYKRICKISFFFHSLVYIIYVKILVYGSDMRAQILHCQTGFWGNKCLKNNNHKTFKKQLNQRERERNVFFNDALNTFYLQLYGREREREMFYLTTHSTHFIYGYMASDIW